MRYVLDIDEKTGKATFQEGDRAPVAVRSFDVNVKREPVVNKEKTEESGFVHYDAGRTGRLTLIADLDYSAPVNIR